MPSKPISLETAEYLMNSGAISFVRPLFGIQEENQKPSNNIVGLCLAGKDNKNSSMLCFNPDMNHWEKISELEYSSIQDMDDLTDDLFDYLLNMYPKGELSVVKFDEGFFHVLEIMPVEPVGMEITELEEQFSSVRTVIPLFCKKDSRTVVVTLVAVDNNTYFLGYEPSEDPDNTSDYELGGCWKVLGSFTENEMLRKSPSDMVESSMLFDWAIERYGKDNILAIETKPP